MISPKYASTHYFFSIADLAGAKLAPHVVNLYLDYNCRFSAILFLKLTESVIPELNKTHPKQFQFVYVNVVQPWHPNSVLLNEFSVVLAKLLREKGAADLNSLFWNFSKLIFDNNKRFYDEANPDLNRNEIYESIANLPGFDDLGLPFGKEEILDELRIKKVRTEDATNSGNGAQTDLKYFTKYLRGVGIHVTPSVSIDGITNGAVSSGDKPETLVKTFGDAI